MVIYFNTSLSVFVNNYIVFYIGIYHHKKADVLSVDFNKSFFIVHYVYILNAIFYLRLNWVVWNNFAIIQFLCPLHNKSTINVIHDLEKKYYN